MLTLALTLLCQTLGRQATPPLLLFIRVTEASATQAHLPAIYHLIRDPFTVQMRGFHPHSTLGLPLDLASQAVSGPGVVGTASLDLSKAKHRYFAMVLADMLLLCLCQFYIQRCPQVLWYWNTRNCSTGTQC